MKMIWFEDMKADLGQVLEELNQFLGLRLPSDQLDELQDHLSIDNMRKAATSEEDKKWINKFIRINGRMDDGGGWKNHVISAHEKQKTWDDWIRDNLSGTTAARRFLKPNQQQQHI